MKEYKIVYRGGEGEIVEKKSRFIATVRPVESEEEASSFIAEMKKKYWNATHNCSAFVVGEHNEIQRSNDDGEPSGTAGHPMLDVLLGEGIHNAAVVVTRYFGGTLLGTGGLVRAYSKSVQAGLAGCTVLVKKKGFLLRMETDYTGIGKIQYILGQRGLLITGSEYTDKVTVETLVPEAELSSLKEEITEGTSGRTLFAEEKEVFYAFDGKEPVML
ncbi:MAG: YigZ family protein [Firmicutes bacterium]|nr:YigZ family protein [Lachnospiraceae bacterium]MDD6065591.1 YigZ family protein [Bacillota bacterium]